MRQDDPGKFSGMTFGLRDEKWAISGSGGRAFSMEGSASVKVLKQEELWVSQGQQGQCR